MDKIKVDVNALGIDEKLARKYNAIINFVNEDTVYEDGCINAKIEKVEYVRKDIPNKIFETRDYIQITESTFNHVLCINNPKALHIDKKYNSIVRVGDLKV